MACMTYDDFYLIFGNSEIRIKAAEDTLYSSFAINTAFFNHGSDRVSNFLYGYSSGFDIPQREVRMRGY